jgi:superfamily II DNA/RNA helicase
MCPTAYIHRVGRTGRYSDEGTALTFVSSNIFVKLAEEEQKIHFQEMKNEDEIIKLAVDCSLKNEKAAENDQHRYEYD